MKTKLVNRYYCDYCKKSGCSKGHMIKHEKHCTMNPNRECRMCELMEQEQRKIFDLIELIKPHLSVATADQNFIADTIMINKEGLNILDNETNGCPNCILATLRQAGVEMITVDWDYKKACEEFWSDYEDKL